MPRPKSPYPYLLKHSHLHAWANHGTCFRQMLLSLLPIFPPFLYSHCQKWRSYTLLYFPNKHTDYWNKHKVQQNSKLRTKICHDIVYQELIFWKVLNRKCVVYVYFWHPCNLYRTHAIRGARLLFKKYILDSHTVVRSTKIWPCACTKDRQNSFNRTNFM